MEKPVFHTTFQVNFGDQGPYIESRARVIQGSDPDLPAGKVMVVRTPILPPGAAEEDIRRASTTEIIDDAHALDPYHCEECKKLGLSPYAWMGQLQPWPFGPHVGRNDPCPCGSGKKYKKCHGR